MRLSCSSQWSGSMLRWRIGGIQTHGRAAAATRARACAWRQLLSHGTSAHTCPAAGITAKRWFTVDAACTGSYQDRGRLFEDQVMRVMTTLDCHLQPTPISHDGGVDHQGVWTLPDRSIEVVTQCKHTNKPLGVQQLREFHGVLQLFPVNTLGLVFSASGYSIFAQRFFRRMPHAAVLCTFERGRISSFLLNDQAQSLLPKLTTGSLFVDQQHELVITYGQQILGAAA